MPTFKCTNKKCDNYNKKITYHKATWKKGIHNKFCDDCGQYLKFIEPKTSPHDVNITWNIGGRKMWSKDYKGTYC